MNFPVPTDESIERTARLIALAQVGKPEWPSHLSEIERDLYRLKAMEMVGLLRKTVTGS